VLLPGLAGLGGERRDLEIVIVGGHGQSPGNFSRVIAEAPVEQAEAECVAILMSDLEDLPSEGGRGSDGMPSMVAGASKRVNTGSRAL
jgi:hypothetical protein